MTNIYKFIDDKKIDMENIGYVVESVEEFNKNPNEYFPEWDSETMRVAEEKYEFPRWDNKKQQVRMKTREEFIYEDNKMDYLLDGEKFQDGHIIQVPNPSTKYLKYNWNKETFQWELITTKEELQQTRKNLILDYSKKKEEIAILESVKEFNTVDDVKTSKEELAKKKEEIDELTTIIEEMNKNAKVQQ